jgi:hypothetical protein
MDNKWYISLDTHPEKYVVRWYQDILNILGECSAFDIDIFSATKAVVWKGDDVVEILEKIGDEWIYKYRKFRV